MRRVSYLVGLLLVLMIAGCGGGNNTPTNVGLFGDWNIVMYPNGNPNPSYVFAMAISQEGTNNYSGSAIAYTGGVPVPSDECIDTAALRASGVTSGTNFTLTFTDPTTSTVITVQGSLSTQTTTLSGTYTNPASQSCSASSGTMTMTPQ